MAKRSIVGRRFQETEVTPPVVGRITLTLSRACGWVGLLLLLAPLGLAQEPLTVENLTDRSTYTDRASFRVPASAGYAYTVKLDGASVAAEFTQTVTTMDYHELSVTRTNLSTLDVTNRLIRFIVVSSERGSPEKGLIRWTPYPLVPSSTDECSGALLQTIVPREYPVGLPIPVVVWVEDPQGAARRVNGTVTSPGFESSPVQVRRGVGSGFLPPANVPGDWVYRPALQGLQATNEITIAALTTWTERSGTLSASEEWPAQSRVHVSGGLTVPADLVLTIGPGTVVLLDPLVNITNSGRCLIQGTASQPVVFTAANVVVPENPAGAWGGFVMRGSNAVLEASGAIFAGGGGGEHWYFGSGSSHKSQQPVFFFHSGAAVRMTNCAVLNTAGQVGNGYESELTLQHTLWQRAITGGEYVGGTVTIDRSALIEFPQDDGMVNAAIADGDYDGIYFTTGTHVLRDSLFGFAKDDAIDSGSGGAGTVLVTNCWVESAWHEAHAWSGTGRIAKTFDTVLMNSGQGLECGWSSGDNSPDCSATRLLSIGNSVGLRFGDNYDWDYWGLLQVNDSLILHNYRDVWGMNWDNWLDGIYTPTGPFRMMVESNFLTHANPLHPKNSVWDPARDAARLVHWMATPPAAKVGIGFAVWTNQMPSPSILDGVPVRLSSFTTNRVSVDYAFETAAGRPVSAGTLTFEPGETVQRAFAAGIDGLTEPFLRAVLRHPIGCEVTGLANVYFLPREIVTDPRLVPGLAAWQYLDTGVDPGTDWREPNFDDSGWSNGLAQLGFGDGDEQTEVRRTQPNGEGIVTLYFRHRFAVPDPGSLTNLSLWLLRDDGAVVYLNGREAFRSPSMPPSPAPITYQTLATNLSSSSAPADNSIDVANLDPTWLVPGTNCVAVEVHQHTRGSSDMSFDLALSGEPTPATPPPRLYFGLFDDGLTLAWAEPGHVLEAADQVDGPWSMVPGGSPVALKVSRSQRFFRLSR